jgi:hypothetical protein
MDRTHILDLYEWELGTCFRHPSKGEIATAHVKTIRPPGGGLQDVRACRDCVIAMEQERQRAAQSGGGAYEPGRLADAEA